MIQRHITHPAGRFRPCACGRQPLHIRSHGRSSTETAGLCAPRIERNHLECPHCGIATAKVASLRTAIIDWNQHYAREPRKVAA